MKEITLGNNTYLLVEVPEETVAVELTYTTNKLVCWEDGSFAEIELPDADYELLGLCRDISEEVWRGIVTCRYEYGKGGYKGVLLCKDYGNGGALPTATESARSLVKAHSMDFDKTVLIKKK